MASNFQCLFAYYYYRTLLYKILHIGFALTLTVLLTSCALAQSTYHLLPTDVPLITDIATVTSSPIPSYTPTPKATATPVVFLPYPKPIPDIASTPAIKPPKYRPMERVIVGVSQDDLAFFRYQAIFPEFERITNQEGKSVFSSRAEFEQIMADFITKHPEYEISQVQSEDHTSVLTYIAKKSDTGFYSVLLPFKNGKLAYVIPNIYDSESVLREVRMPRGYNHPEFIYNSEDGHWYLMAVYNAKEEASHWFKTDGTTLDNMDSQWTRIHSTTNFEGIFSERYYPNQFTDSFIYTDQQSGIELPIYLGLTNDLPVTAVEFSDVGREFLGESLLTGFYIAYTRMPGNQDVTKEQWMNEVLSGRGQVEFCYFDDITGEKKVGLLNPLQGISVTVTGQGNLPLDTMPANAAFHNTYYFSANNKGQLIVVQSSTKDFLKEAYKSQVIMRKNTLGYFYSDHIGAEFFGGINYVGEVDPYIFNSGGHADDYQPLRHPLLRQLSKKYYELYPYDALSATTQSHTPFLSVTLR